MARPARTGAWGFYSHTFLHNLLGSDIHNADRIVPELQDLQVGSIVWLASPDKLGPRAPHFTVAHLEPMHALVLHADAAPEAAFAATWAFILAPLPRRRTRLVVRYRASSNPRWLAPILGLEPVHFIMERRMLHAIRQRAERLWTKTSERST